MASSLAELAQLVGGRLVGDGDLAITGAATLETAVPGEITLIDSAQKAQRLARSHASAVVVPRDLAPSGLAAIQVDDVHAAFGKIVRHFHPQRATKHTGISPLAIVSPTARIADGADIHPSATIGDDVVIGAGVTIHCGVHVMAGCEIEPGATIYPGAVLYENTVIRARAIIHAGAVLGAHGFGYKLVEGRHQLSAQLGYVEIGADAEIGANTTIDRGTYGPTVIGEGTKIDNLVMIAHNCRIGKHNMICSQVGIAGSTSTGDYVVMAGQVGVRDHVHIGDRAVLGAMAGVVNDVPPGAHMLGAPAIPEREQKINFAMLAKLPEMRRQLKQLQRSIDALTGDKPDSAAA
jgi:UDP-3-O-[3-hydroxymyristoyl] glucosamine N-acyltransferase